MSSLCNKKISYDITGVLNLDKNDIIVEVEDIGEVILRDFVKELDGFEVKITIVNKEEL